MPVDLFPNATNAEIVALIESLQRRLTVGEVQFVTLPGGGQMQRTVQNTRDCEVMLERALYSAYKKGIPGYDNPYVQRIRKTLPYYT